MSFTIGKGITVARVQSGKICARSVRETGENFFTENRNFGQNRKSANNARRPSHKTSLHFNVRPENGSGAGRMRLAATRSQFWTLRN